MRIESQGEHRIVRRSLQLAALLGLAFVCLTAGLAVGVLQPATVALVAGVAVLLYVFLWFGLDPFVPYLILVVALQGGLLLRLPVATGPFRTFLPALGGWVLLALFLGYVRDRGNMQREAAAEELHEAASGLLDAETRKAPAMLVLSVGAFFLIAVVTAAVRGWMGEEFDATYGELLTLAQLGVLVFVSVALLTNPRRVIIVGAVIVASGVASAILALSVRYGAAVSGAETIEGDTARAVGTLADPNFFSFQLLTPFAFAVQMLFVLRGRLVKLMLLASAGVLIAGVIATYSAGALVGLAAVLLTTIVLLARISVSRAGLALGFLCILTVAVAILAPREYVDVVNQKYAAITNSSVETWGTGRVASWQAATGALAESPFLGSSLATESIQAAIAPHYKPEILTHKAAHNMYLSTGVGLGLFGMVAFLLVLAGSLTALWRKREAAIAAGDAASMKAVSLLIPALVLVCTQGLQLDLHKEKFLWLLVGAAVAVSRWRLAPSDR